MTDPSASGWLDRTSAAALGLDEVLRTVASLAITDLGRAALLQLDRAADDSTRSSRRSLFTLLEPTLADGPLVRRLGTEALGLASPLELLSEVRPHLDGPALVYLADLLRQASAAERRLRPLEERVADEVAEEAVSAGAGAADAQSGLIDLLRNAAEATELAWAPNGDRALCAIEEPAGAEQTSLQQLQAERLEEFARLVHDRLDEQGEIRPDATPALRAATQKVARRRRSLYEEFEGFLGRHEGVFEEQTLSMRDGRLTALLPSGSKGQVGGLHHGRSSTGRSFYFEPLELVDGNNALQDARAEEAAERARVLEELHAALQSVREIAALALRVLGALDAQQAVRAWADLARADLVEPVAADEGIELVAARHPLLDPALREVRRDALGDGGHRGEVVPLDLSLRRERLLVITGPNAGGKTVTLKTVGLFCALHRLGLPLPCERNSRLPVVDRIVAVVGDDQDLLQDQSTFSARLGRLHQAWKAAAPGALVLLDEVGSGTSPQEGWALSRPLMDRLVDQGATALMTTHLVELAAHALEREGALCAGMEFDPELDAPRFRIRVGPPVASQALSLGRRLGLDPQWLQEAEGLLGSEYGGLVALLEEAEAERDRLQAEARRLETLRRDQEKLERRLSEQEAALIDEKKTLRRRLEDELRKVRSEVRQQIEKEVEKLRTESRRTNRAGGTVGAPGRGATEAVIARVVQEAAGDAASDLGLDQTPVATPEDREPEQGDFVRHRALGWQGRLEECSAGRAVVAVGGKRLRCRIEELALAPEPKPASSMRSAKPLRRGKPSQRRKPTDDLSSADAHLVELNLIGQRVAESLDQLDAHLDQATLASLASVRVIHGHGSGRLRTAVREHLRGHPHVQSYRPGEPREGGNGATVVVLQGGSDDRAGRQGAESRG